MSRDADGSTRFDRRRAQTRAALISTAQSFLAEGRVNVAIQEVTERADVAVGTFYNHFTSKEELFAVGLADAVEQFGVVLDALSQDVLDPAESFARSFRLLGRMHRVEPKLSRVLLANAHELSRAADGVGPRARRDIEAAVAAGRFDVVDVDRAMVLVTGAMTELGYLLHDLPERDDAATVDGVASDVLVALGMSRAEANALCQQPLPSPSPIEF